MSMPWMCWASSLGLRHPWTCDCWPRWSRSPRLNAPWSLRSTCSAVHPGDGASSTTALGYSSSLNREPASGASTLNTRSAYTATLPSWRRARHLNRHSTGLSCATAPVLATVPMYWHWRCPLASGSSWLTGVLSPRFTPTSASPCWQCVKRTTQPPLHGCCCVVTK